MSKAPAMPVFTDALIGDTTHLTAEEFGAYCLILFATWRNNGTAIENDDIRLRRIARIAPQRWSRIRKSIVEFFDLSDGTWRQKRLEKEWSYTQSKIEQQRTKGHKGAQSRWELIRSDMPITELTKDTSVIEETDQISSDDKPLENNKTTNGTGMLTANGTSNAQAMAPIPIKERTPLPPQVGERKSAPANGYTSRANKTNPRALHDPWQLANLSPTELGLRFNDKSRPRDERLAIRKILLPNAYPPEPGTFN